MNAHNLLGNVVSHSSWLPHSYCHFSFPLAAAVFFAQTFFLLLYYYFIFYFVELYKINKWFRNTNIGNCSCMKWNVKKLSSVGYTLGRNISKKSFTFVMWLFSSYFSRIIISFFFVHKQIYKWKYFSFMFVIFLLL